MSLLCFDWVPLLVLSRFSARKNFCIVSSFVKLQELQTKKIRNEAYRSELCSVLAKFGKWRKFISCTGISGVVLYVGCHVPRSDCLIGAQVYAVYQVRLKSSIAADRMCLLTLNIRK